MLKRLFLSLVALLAGSLSAPAQEATAAKIIETGHLRGLDARTGFEVTLRQAATSGATISVDSRLQPYLRAEVRDGILYLGINQLPRELQRKRLPRRAEVTVSSLEKLEAHSGAHITGTGSFASADDCDIEATSGAWIEGLDLTAQKEAEIDLSSGAQISRSRIAAEEVDIDVSSGAQLTLGGTAGRLKAKVSSGASADLIDLAAAEVKASASSGGSIRCRTTNRLEASASSGGSIRYRAENGLSHPAIHTSSGGSVRQIN